MSFVPYPWNALPGAATARILDRMREALPGWVPVEGAVEVALAEEIGREIGDLGDLVVDVSNAIVTYLGQTLFNVPTIPGASASIPVFLQLTRPGATVPAGFTVVGRSDDGVDVRFRLDADLATPAAATSVMVTLEATDPGTYGNGVMAGPLTLATATDAVVSVTATGVSTGGRESETDSAYRDRLTATLATMTRTPILARDYAVRARDVEGVTRALVLAGLDLSTGTTGAERTVALFPVDAEGMPVSEEVQASLLDTLDTLREITFQVQVGTPTYSPVSLSFSGVAKRGADPAVVTQAVRARAAQLLSPAVWGGGDDSPPVWEDSPLVRRNALLADLAAVEGVAYLSALTLNGTDSDLVLAGPAGMPAPTSSGQAAVLGVAPSTITGTIQGA